MNGINQQVDILIVEDTLSDVELTRHVFRKHNIMNFVHVVDDGEKAFSFIKSRKIKDFPLLMFLDLHMPGMDGLTLLGKLEEEIKDGLTVIIMTTDDNDINIAKAYTLGALAYVVKPISLKNLSAAMIQSAGLVFKIFKYKQ